MEQTNNQQQKELDLVELIRLFFDWCKKATKWCINILISAIKLNIKYWYIVVLCLAVAIGCFFVTKRTPVYSAEFTIQTFKVGAQHVINRINLLNQELETNKSTLAKELGVSKATIDNLINIQAYLVIDVTGDGIADRKVKDIADTLQKPMKYNALCVIETKNDCTTTEELGYAIVKYISKDTILNKMSTYYNNIDLEEIARYEELIKVSDSLRRTLSGKNVSLSSFTKDDNVISDPYAIAQTQKLIEFVAQMKNNRANYNNSIIAIDSKFKYAENNDNCIKLTQLLVGFYLLSLIIALCIEKRKSIKNAFKA